jgi:hypothetical protein
MVLLDEFDGVSSTINGGGGIADSIESSIGDNDRLSIGGEDCFCFGGLIWPDLSSVALTSSSLPKTLSLCVLDSSTRSAASSVFFGGVSALLGDPVLDESAETCLGEFPRRKKSTPRTIKSPRSQKNRWDNAIEISSAQAYLASVGQSALSRSSLQTAAT